MKLSSPRASRSPSALSELYQRRLNSYALAASAAGVGALVLAHPAQAKIVYTPAHAVIDGLGNNKYALDLNHDGINDFSFVNTDVGDQSGSFAYLRCGPLTNANAVRGRGFFESTLRESVKVGPRGPFNGVRMGTVAYQTIGHFLFEGPWVNSGKGVKDRYLGLKFMIKGKVHYGWARLNVKIKGSFPINIRATLTGYAYETIPNKPIITGKTKGEDVVTVQPVSLGHLAQGANSILAWRVKQVGATSH